jgi:hypothetical protein
LRRGGRSSLANASGLDTHCDSITGRCSDEEFGLFINSPSPQFELHVQSLKHRLRACGPSPEDWERVSQNG